jgi:rare lipoprotein A (peptidoglycan hydrolase)
LQKRALTLSLAGVTALAAVSTGIVVNADDVSQAANTVAAPQKDTSAAAPAESATKKAEETKKQAAEKKAKALYAGTTTASYFWDDGSGINGDTGAPAGGKPMQKGLFASPSWPLHTKVKVTYNGRSVTGFVGDRGPGKPSHRGIMLDLDTYTFRYLYDGKQPSSKYNAGVGAGHLKGVKYEVLQWGKGAGKKGAPQPFGS